MKKGITRRLLVRTLASLVLIGVIMAGFYVFVHRSNTPKLSPYRVLADKVMAAQKSCDLETIRNLAHRQLFTTVVQVNNFKQHCQPNALTYSFASEKVNYYHRRLANNSTLNYSNSFDQYSAHLNGKTFPIVVISEQESGKPIQFSSVTDPYYDYIKGKNIFSEGSAP